MKHIYFLTAFIFFNLVHVKGQTISDYNLLIVGGTFAIDTKTELEALGHTATIVPASSLMAGYDYSSYKSVIFMYDSPEPSGISEILALNTNNQLGIILMRGENLVDNCDMGTAVTWSSTDFTIVDNSHYITQAFSIGTLDLGFTYKSNLTAINPGNTILGAVSSGNGSLVVSNNYRRVLSPYYGHTVGMPWNSDAAILMDRIIAWTSSNETLSLNNNIALKKVKISPNPSSQHIKLSGLTTTETYKIFNSIGAEIANGHISNNETIEIGNYSTGLYVLQFEDGNTIKFLKE